jgi:hypothetical protein
VEALSPPLADFILVHAQPNTRAHRVVVCDNVVMAYNLKRALAVVLFKHLHVRGSREDGRGRRGTQQGARGKACKARGDTRVAPVVFLFGVVLSDVCSRSNHVGPDGCPTCAAC